MHFYIVLYFEKSNDKTCLYYCITALRKIKTKTKSDNVARQNALPIEIYVGLDSMQFVIIFSQLNYNSPIMDDF